MADLYIGLMSGTSLDGVDGVLARFEPLEIVAHVHRPFDPALRAELLALNGPAEDELSRAARAGNALAGLYARVVASLLASASCEVADVRAIGAHGQTVRHCPQPRQGAGYTVQLNNPALLAELCGIDVVADFRSRDIAAGGQGAPLVPAFHRAVFARPRDMVVVLNLGGISNLSVLDAAHTLGFDCGPGNVLMDHWCQRHTGRPFDTSGGWAASGRVLAPLLASMLSEPYFGVAPPKSTGRDLFNAARLDAQLVDHAASAAPEDVQATLAELTAQCIARDVGRYAPAACELLVCGGGAYNDHLLRRIAALLPATTIATSETRGLPPTQVEATAFAWLAGRFVLRLPGNLSTVTGAAGPRVLGALYPG